MIVFTGLGSEESAEVALRYGAWDFVRKPVTYAEFLKRIKSAIPA